MRQQYLLLEDVEDVGRSGEIITVKPGFARNYLLPQKKAVQATEHTLRMQERLRTERAKKAALDRKDAEDLAKKLEGSFLEISVKVDPDGHMYGSVGAAEIAALFVTQGFSVDRKNVGVHLHLKELGTHHLTLKLKEGVSCSYSLNILPEEEI